TAALSKRQYEIAEKQFEMALREAEYFGPQDYRLIRSMDNLARAYHVQNKYADAEPLYLRALSLQEAMQGPEHISIASRLITLSEFYYYQPERRTEVEPLMTRALRIQEKVLGADSPELALTLIQLGYWHGLSKRDSEAESLLTRGLAIQQKVYGKESPILNTVLTYLAAVRIRQQRLDEAEALYRQVQDVLEKAITSKEIEVPAGPIAFSKEEWRLQTARAYAARLRNLTSFYMARQRHEEAEEQYQHALKLLEQEFGPDHSTVGMVLESYAILLRRTNRAAEAEKAEARAKTIKQSLINISK
ncbi:MAG TPA: tetratricopeptide repeat-containing protein, partial [Blastocatellia bacterium]